MVPKRIGIIREMNEQGEEVQNRVSIGYRKLNLVTKKYHYPVPLIDQIFLSLWLFGL